MTPPDIATVKKPTVDEGLTQRAEALLKQEATAKRLADLEDLKDSLKAARDSERDAVIKQELAAVLDRVFEAINQGYCTDTGHHWPR